MKKIGLMTLLAISAVVICMAFPAAAAPPKAPVPALPAVAAVAAAPAPAAMPERHPHIHEAMEAMHAAKHHLESAGHDFDGHRVEAIRHLDAAIHEAEICEQMR
ncbi:MAG TPA: hypothetical protein VI386_15385 [Candidatus Sulfotelmatobacter sp.]